MIPPLIPKLLHTNFHFMNPRNVFSPFIKKIRYAQNILKQVTGLVNDPKFSKTYFPQAEHKSKFVIWRDILLWLARHKEVHRYYYVYGFDRKNNNVEKEMLPYRTFRTIRDKANLHPDTINFNYASLLRDKFIFGQLLCSLQFPTPKNIALLDHAGVTWLNSMKTISLSSLNSDEHLNIDGFCKKLMGMRGEGAFPLRITGGKIYSGETELTAEHLSEKISGQYLLQERILQHQAISMLHPHSVNTLRIVTFNNYGVTEVFCAMLRMGTNKRNIDNWAAGGIVVGIELESGTLRKEGLYKPGYGGRVESHPDTGVALDGYVVPYFKKSVEMACRLHRYLYGIHSIGWDIAITPDGPVFIEGNEDWDGSITMSLEKNFKSRFLKMFPQNGNWKKQKQYV